MMSLPPVAELAQVGQRLLRGAHGVLPLAQLVRERDEQLAVALALVGGEGEDTRQVVFFRRRLIGLEACVFREGGGGRGRRRRSQLRGQGSRAKVARAYCGSVRMVSLGTEL